jgi:surface protein
MATIAQNLAALQQARTDIAEAITDKGVTLEEGAGFTDFPSAIEDIPTGVDTSNDTVTPATLADGVTAHNAAGEQIEGTMQGGLEMNVKFTAGNKAIPAYMFYNNHGSGSKNSAYPIEKVVIGDGVTSIGRYAFGYCGGLTSVTIPDSVTSIDAAAFFECAGLTSVTIPDSVTSIGNNAFYNCKSLTSVTIGNGVTSIGSDVFSGCTSLTSINVGNNNTQYSSVDGVLYNKDKTVLIRCPQGKTSIAIPNSVTSIDAAAFVGCAGLTSVTIPDSVTEISTSAFVGCAGLTSVTIPNSVTSIGNWAFRNCSNLTTIIINKRSGSISGSPWGATNATVVWTG